MSTLCHAAKSLVTMPTVRARHCRDLISIDQKPSWCVRMQSHQGCSCVCVCTCMLKGVAELVRSRVAATDSGTSARAAPRAYDTLTQPRPCKKFVDKKNPIRNHTRSPVGCKTPESRRASSSHPTNYRVSTLRTPYQTPPSCWPRGYLVSTQRTRYHIPN